MIPIIIINFLYNITIYIDTHFYLLLLHACNELINDDWKHKVSCMDYLIIIKDYN